MTSSNSKSTDGIPPTNVILPNTKIHFYLHNLRLPWATPEKKKESMQSLLFEIKKDEMLPLYLACCHEFNIQQDNELTKKLEDANQQELDKINEKIVDAEENLGDVEVKDCFLEKANYYCRIGHMEKAIDAYQLAQEKTVGAGGRLNIALTLVRICILFLSSKVTTKYLTLAKKDCSEGGDWEKRNKLNIYEALYLIQQGSFKQAAELFYSCVAIFTATEIISFEQFIVLTVILAMGTFDRPALKKKIISSPEISQVLEEKPLYKDLLHSLYYCEYRKFMGCLVPLFNEMRNDPYLMNHASRLIKLIRLKAYEQHLNPYSSILVDLMAKDFGVSKHFLENDLAEYVESGKLNCKIDHYRWTIHCSRSIQTQNLYTEAIKEGDILLEKIQNLAKIIDM